MDDTVDFYRDWSDYKAGFGDVNGNFWVGLETLHLLTQEDTELYVYLEAGDTDNAYASYSSFVIDGEDEKYRLHVSGYTGTAGDGMTLQQDGMKFSTRDQDNDIHGSNCATEFKGAWWYGSCHNSNLNGLYLNGSHNDRAVGINWYQYKGFFLLFNICRNENKEKTLNPD